MLSDEGKRKEYDTWGQTAYDVRKQRANEKAAEKDDPIQAWRKAWSFQSSVDPEELFRKIFGDNFNEANPFEETTPFARSVYGYGEAQEVGWLLAVIKSTIT